jgi:hypothetical protein
VAVLAAELATALILVVVEQVDTVPIPKIYLLECNMLSQLEAVEPPIL